MHMDLDIRACDRARLARDPRFDGRFFTSVVHFANQIWDFTGTVYVSLNRTTGDTEFTYEIWFNRCPPRGYSTFACFPSPCDTFPSIIWHIGQGTPGMIGSLDKWAARLLCCLFQCCRAAQKR
jgi:hypothetical protein